MPIAVFDSGVGGISVLRELEKIMPGEDYIYYGDSANAPYEEKHWEKEGNLRVSMQDACLLTKVRKDWSWHATQPQVQQ